MSKSKWSLETLKNEAIKYSSRKEFRKSSYGAYQAAIRTNVLNDICSHMDILGNFFNRLIYIYEFPDNHVYIGLSGNSKKRIIQHREKGSVYNYSLKTNLIPKYKELIDYINYQEASKLEIETIERYKKMGFTLLNSQKGGGLGGNFIIWNYDKCKAEALKYNNRKMFAKGSVSAFNSAYKKGWLNEICEHMINGYKKSNYWSKELCEKEALKYNTIKDFSNGNKSAYNFALKNNFIEDICSHMNYNKKRSKNFWNYITCKEEASKYSNKTEFYKNCRGAYNFSYNQKLLDDFFPKKINSNHEMD